MVHVEPFDLLCQGTVFLRHHAAKHTKIARFDDNCGDTVLSDVDYLVNVLIMN